MRVVRCSLPTVSASVARTAISAPSITRVSTSRSTRSVSSRVTTVILTRITSFEWVEKLILIVDELLKLVLIKVVGGVETIIAAFALSSFDHIWTAHEDYRNKLERRVNRVNVIFSAMVLQL